VSELLAAPGNLTWVSTNWNDPRAAALRAEMDVEIGARYAGRDNGSYPSGPEAVEVPVVWLALAETPAGTFENAATATLRRLQVAGEPLRYEVKRVFVSAAHRRRGLAAAALARVEGSARDLGVDELLLQTGDRQPEAEALYVREGWHHVPPYPPYDHLVHSRCYGKTL
jgi:GNAT superfamily N-acetyltransferase